MQGRLQSYLRELKQLRSHLQSGEAIIFGGVKLSSRVAKLPSGCASEVQGRVSPYITPPSRPIVRDRRVSSDPSRGDTCSKCIFEVHTPGSVASSYSHCIGMLIIEGSDCIFGVDIIGRNPFIVFIPIALPVDKVLESVPVVARIEDLLHLIFFFAINHNWRGRGRLSASGEWIFGGWGELDYRKYWMKASHFLGELQPI
jgi:hypothetical protein